MIQNHTSFSAAKFLFSSVYTAIAATLLLGITEPLAKSSRIPAYAKAMSVTKQKSVIKHHNQKGIKQLQKPKGTSPVNGACDSGRRSKVAKMNSATASSVCAARQDSSVDAKTLNSVKEFEGFKAQAYIDTDGTPVIGYGMSQIKGQKVKLGDRISEAEAEAALEQKLQQIQEQILTEVKVDLNPNQLSALTSISFNVGFGAIKTSTLLKKLNAGDRQGAADEFLRWNKADVGGRLVPMAGLTRRRQLERQLFLTQVGS